MIPTLNGGGVFRRCLQQIRIQRFKDEVQLIVIDSGSTDDTLQSAEGAGAEVLHVLPADFHHAHTRNLALPRVRYDYVVFMVQDALPVGDDWLAALQRSIASSSADAVHVKQIPHDDADAYSTVEMQLIAEAAGDRPRLQQVSSIEQFHAMPFDQAYHTIRLDNVCAVYQKAALLQRPFPTIEFAEDLAWGCATILSGGKILYEPGIAVNHSHNRSPDYRFNREIINSIACASIMQRVREDLSFITLSNLLLLSVLFQDYIRLFCRQALSDKSAAIEKPSLYFKDSLAKIFNKHNLKTKIKMGYARTFLRNKPLTDSRIEAVFNNLKAHVQYEFTLIRERSVLVLAEEVIAVIDIIAARTLGRLYGEVYAGKMLNQCLDAEFKDFISPFRRGV